MTTTGATTFICAIVGTAQLVWIELDADKLVEDLQEQIATAAGLSNMSPSLLHLYRVIPNEKDRLPCTIEMVKVLRSALLETMSTCLKRELLLDLEMRVSQYFDGELQVAGTVDVFVCLWAPMLDLVCMVVGGLEVWRVPVSADLPVGRLKAEVLKSPPFDRDDWKETSIDLYLASRYGTADGPWMSKKDDALAELQHAPLSSDTERKYLASKLLLDPTRAVGYYFPMRKLVSDGDIHVIVDVPNGCNINPETGKRKRIHSKGMVQARL